VGKKLELLGAEHAIELTKAKEKKPRKPRTVRRKVLNPTFISKVELAQDMGCSTQAIDDWIELGSFPPPHSRPGARHTIWLRKHYDEYVKTRHWPKEAYHAG
jgi:predicted DNA-binding transcriptional regulator AlpA